LLWIFQQSSHPKFAQVQHKNEAIPFSFSGLIVCLHLISVIYRPDKDQRGQAVFSSSFFAADDCFVKFNYCRACPVVSIILDKIMNKFMIT